MVSSGVPLITTISLTGASAVVAPAVSMRSCWPSTRPKRTPRMSSWVAPRCRQAWLSSHQYGGRFTAPVGVKRFQCGSTRIGERGRAAGGRVGQAVADLEVDHAAAGGQGLAVHRGGDGRRARGDLELEQRRGDGRGHRLVVDEARQVQQREGLGGRPEQRFPGDPVLEVTELVRHGGQHLHDHHAHVGLGPLQPRGVALRRELRERLDEAAEVLGQVVDRHLQRLRGRAAGGGGAAVKGAGAVGLEGERGRREVRIELCAGDGEAVGREVAGSLDGHRQDRPALAIGGPGAGLVDGADGDAGDHLAPRDGDGRGAGRRDQGAPYRYLVEEVHQERPLVGGRHLDVVDAVPGRPGAEQELAAVARQRAGGHCRITVVEAGSCVSTSV